MSMLAFFSSATGLLLQVDCPDLAMGRHTRHVDLTDDEFKAVAEANVAALNFALQAVPASQVRIHICWGNYAGPHHHDIAASIVWPSVATVHCKYILIEAANPRHGHEVAAFEAPCPYCKLHHYKAWRSSRAVAEVVPPVSIEDKQKYSGAKVKVWGEAFGRYAYEKGMRDLLFWSTVCLMLPLLLVVLFPYR